MVHDYPIHVLVVDPHEIVCNSLRFLLAVYDDLSLAAVAFNAKDGLSLCTTLHPDVVLTSLHLPDMDSLMFIRSIAQNHPDIKVIVLSTSRQKNDIEAALRAGASGYMVKEIGIDELAETIRGVVN